METEPHSIFSSPANGLTFSPHPKCLEHAFFFHKECRRPGQTLIPVCMKWLVWCRLFLNHRRQHYWTESPVMLFVYQIGTKHKRTSVLVLGARRQAVLQPKIALLTVCILRTSIISLLSVIHTIHSIIQNEIQGLHVSTVYCHLQALFLN